MQYTAMDITIFLIVLAGVIGFAIFPKQKLSRTLYWVNDRSTGISFLSTSLISSIVGAGTLVGVASIGFLGGLAGVYLGVANGIGVILFGLWAAPRINRLGKEKDWYSITDPLKERYDLGTVRLIGAVNLIAFFFFAAAQFSALALILSSVFGLEWWISVLSATAILIIYVTYGGLHADIRTDFLQLFLMGGGALILLVSLFNHADFNFNALLNLPSGYYSGFAYAGAEFIIFAVLLLPPGVFVSLDMWQRAYAAQSPKVAKTSFVIGGFLMLLFFFAFGLIGMITFTLDPTASADTAILYAINTAMPIGITGILLAGLVAALMSTADSMLIAASLSIANDMSNKKYLDSPHVISFVLGIGAAIVAFSLPNIVDLLLNAFSSLLVLAPLFIGLKWKRATAFAAKSAVALGLLTTLAFLFIDPTVAFIPATFISLLSFGLISLFSKRQTT